MRPPLALPHPHLLVVPLQHDVLVLQGLVLALQVHPEQVQVIHHLPQSSDICLHRHSHGQLVLKPERDIEACFTYEAAQENSMMGMHSLHLEILGSQLCIVSVQDGFGIELGGDANLRAEQKE